MVKPQLPSTAVVTPSAGDGSTNGIPGDLRVVVGVAVDDAGHQRQAVGLHRLLRCAEPAADVGDPAAGHAEVAAHGRAPEPSKISASLITRSNIMAPPDFRHGVTPRQPFPGPLALNRAMSDANDEALLSRLVAALVSVPSMPRLSTSWSRSLPRLSVFGRIEQAPPRC